jgi:NADH dehydrogenase
MATPNRPLVTHRVVPTGVELAGAMGEMTRYTLTRDFRRIDSRQTRILLLEGGPRILPSFSVEHSAKAVRVLEGLGVQVWTNAKVTDIREQGVAIGDEFVQAATVLWAAGVRGSRLAEKSVFETDSAGRAIVEPDLSVKGFPTVFVAGDLAHVVDEHGKMVPGMAPAALQEGRYLGQLIRDEIQGKPRKAFRYWNKGQMATIGRSQAVLESGKLNMSGMAAWIAWLIIHVYYLTGFRNRFFVVLTWAWSYLRFQRGARLIVRKEWKFFS